MTSDRLKRDQRSDAASGIRPPGPSGFLGNEFDNDSIERLKRGKDSERGKTHSSMRIRGWKQRETRGNVFGTLSPEQMSSKSLPAKTA